MSACERCNGAGVRELTVGAPGHPDVDAETECSDCGGTGKRPIVAVSQTIGAGWAQEWYTTGSGDARRRAAQLRRAGFKVHCSKASWQETRVGRMNLTLLDARGDVLLLPAVRVEGGC